MPPCPRRPSSRSSRNGAASIIGLRIRTGQSRDAGRYLARWVREAGFADYEIHTNVVVMDGDEARFWGNMWSQRILHSNVGADALAYGLAEQADLDRISAAWTRFAESEWPFYMYAQLGVLARK